MIDLYGHLGINADADEAEITQAINRASDPDIRHRARAILLKSSRRPAYDRMWNTLRKLGELRAVLDLNEAPFGQRQEYLDFRYTVRKSKRKQASKTINKLPGWVWVMGVLGLVWIYNELTTKPKPPLQQATQRAPITAKTEPPTRKPAPSSSFDPSTARPLPLEPTARAPVATASPPEETPTVQPLPKTGTRWGKTRFPHNPDNWITVKTKGDRHTVLKIEIDGSQGEEITAQRFIRAGETLKINLPLGNYVLKTATGRQWYGPDLFFGPDCYESAEPCTSYGKADKTFPFQEPGEYWEVELIPQTRGNLREKRIGKSEF